MKNGFQTKHTGTENNRIDPLFVIVEEHLFNKENTNTDRKTFISNIVKDYLVYLKKQQILIPLSMEPQIIEELEHLVAEIVTKKAYGFIKPQDVNKMVPLRRKTKAARKYKRLQSK